MTSPVSFKSQINPILEDIVSKPTCFGRALGNTALKLLEKENPSHADLLSIKDVIEGRLSKITPFKDTISILSKQFSLSPAGETALEEMQNTIDKIDQLLPPNLSSISRNDFC